jgi:hypothetical protein
MAGGSYTRRTRRTMPVIDCVLPAICCQSRTSAS